MKLSKYFIIAVLLSAIVFIVFQYTPHQTAPNFQLTSLKGNSIQTVNSEAPTLVTFWSTSCVACVAEMPKLKQLQADLKVKGFRVIAIAMNYDEPQTLQFFQNKYQINYDIVHDENGQLAKAFQQVRVTPTHFLINKKGNFLYQTIGTPDFTKLERLIIHDLS